MKWREVSKDDLYPFEKAQYRLGKATIQEIIHEKGNYFSLFYWSDYIGNFKTLSLARNEAEKIIKNDKKTITNQKKSNYDKSSRIKS